MEPHEAHFASFDRWARRAVEADPAVRDRDALEETTFAPIRRREEVWGIWIESSDGERPLAFGHLPELPPDLRWARVRHGSLGALEVTTLKIPDPRRRRASEEAGEPCVLVRRAHRSEDGATVAVAVAYHTPSGDVASEPGSGDVE